MEMDIHLVRFVRLLRALGIRVSSAETIDCLNGLIKLNIVDKTQFKVALGSTLVKNREDYQLFQQAFNVYFTSREQRIQSYAEYQQDSREVETALDQADTELQFQAESLDLSPEDKYLYSQLPKKEKEKLQQFLERSSQGKKVEKNFKPIIENLIRGSLDYWKRHLNQEFDKLKQLELDDEELNSYLNKIKKTEPKSEINIVHEDMKNISDRDINKVQVIIKKMTQKLATNISRRYRQSRKVERTDIRRSIRFNMKYGGTLMELKYRTKRIQRPKLVLVCDVSGSMAKYATFIMQFVFGLATVVKNIESFVFAEQLERVTSHFKNKNDFAQTMTQVMNESKVWGEGTDLAASLEQLQANYYQVLNPNTIVIIMSDGKTIAASEAGRKLKQLNKRVKDVIWLNTLPKERWEDTKTVNQFARYSKMYQCNTLSHLDTIIRSQLFS